MDDTFSGAPDYDAVAALLDTDTDWNIGRCQPMVIRL
jgi:hypothetical protein